MGIIDYTSRLAADVIKSTYLRESKLSESRLYFRLVWGMVALGITILLVGFDQPLVLLVISACSGGAIDVPLLVPAHPAEPPGAAGGDRRAIVPAWERWCGRPSSLASSPALTIWQQLPRLARVTHVQTALRRSGGSRHRRERASEAAAAF